MAVFFVLLLVPMVIQHIKVQKYYISDEKKNRAALAFFFCLLTVLVMLRHKSVGNDTENYIYYFKRCARTDWRFLRKIQLEIGYLYFNKLISLVSKEPQFFLAASALTVSALIYPTYKRASVDASLTIVLFCVMSTFVMMFSGIRQMLSIGIGFIAYDFTRRKKLIPFILAVCVACTIHTSAFMLAFMYPLYHARITKKWMFAVVPVLALVFVFNRPIFSILSIFLERYTKYDGTASSTGAYTMLILFVAFTAFSFIIPEESCMDEETIGLRNLLLLALALQMFAPLHMLAMRMNYFYIIFIPLLLPRIISYRNKRWCRIAVAGRYLMVVFFGVYFFIFASAGGNLNVFPYHFFWENVR